MGISSTLSQIAAEARTLRRGLRDVMGKSDARKTLSAYCDSGKQTEVVIFRMSLFLKKRFEEHGLPFSGRDALNFFDWAMLKTPGTSADVTLNRRCRAVRFDWKLVEEYMDERWGTLRQPPVLNPLTDEDLPF